MFSLSLFSQLVIVQYFLSQLVMGAAGGESVLVVGLSQVVSGKTFLSIFLKFYIKNFSGCFDTSGSMIPLSVSEILALDGFCDVLKHELGFLVVG